VVGYWFVVDGMAGGECVGMVNCWSGLCGEDGVVVVCDCVQSA
jgi:hypothetical protein